MDWAKHFREVSNRPLPKVTSRQTPDSRSQYHLDIRTRFGSRDIGRIFGGSDSSSGDPTVRLVQQKLIALRVLAPISAATGKPNDDGTIGPVTQAAIRAYQLGKLPVDGKITKALLDSLGIHAPLPTPPKLPTVSGPTIPGLRQSVTNAAPAFQGKFEGSKLPYMYTDKKGLVTTWSGNLIDPVNMALALTWTKPDGSTATPDEVRADWTKVKNAYPAIQSTAAEPLTTLRLTPENGDKFFFDHLRGDANVLSGKSSSKYGYTNYAQLPADAQMALHSIAWAWGPAFAEVKWGALGTAFKQAIAAMDFQKAADVMTQASAHEETINPGIVPRNQANRELLANAADVVAKKKSYDALYWPGNVGTLVVISGLLYWIVGGAAVLLFMLTTRKVGGSTGLKIL
jgi:Putative peptidoglycan binding domain